MTTADIPDTTGSSPAISLALGEELDQFVDLPTGVRLCYRDFAPSAGVDAQPLPVVLVAGLSLDQASWPQPMLDALADAGFRVITLDNRDAGRSTRFDDQPLPSKVQMLRAKAPAGVYTLEDMGADVVGLLDHLGVDRVHLAGMSMGGMISQVVSAAHPDRVATLTSIFSTTGHHKVGQPAKATLVRMAARAPRTEFDSVAAHLVMTKYLAGPAYAPDVEVEVAHALRTWRRGAGPRNGAGVLRQISAIQASADRTPSLAAITAPTLVIHGDKDPMVAPTGGVATHEAIAGSRHVVIPGMGHHIGPVLDVKLAGLISEHAAGRS